MKYISLSFVTLFFVLLLSGTSCTSQTIELKGVEPSVGDPTTDFTFSCVYQNDSGLDALFVCIEIDGEMHNMSRGLGNPVNGVNYTYTTRLNSGLHYYRYIACNENGEYFNTSLTSIFVNLKNSEPALVNATVTPSSGDESTIFRFSVVYIDTDISQPRYVYLILDGTEYEMEMDSQDGNLRLYTYSTKLKAGIHLFMFKCDDGSNAENAYAQTSLYPLNVKKINHAPELYYAQVLPKTGVSGTVFNFSVMYKDEDGNSPKFVKLILDNELKDIGVQRGTDISSGVTFEFKTRLGSGTHIYKFVCDDNSDALNSSLSTDEFSMNVLSPVMRDDSTMKLALICIGLIGVAGLGLWITYGKNKKKTNLTDAVEEVDAELEEITNTAKTGKEQKIKKNISYETNNGTNAENVKDVTETEEKTEKTIEKTIEKKSGKIDDKSSISNKNKKS